MVGKNLGIISIYHLGIFWVYCHTHGFPYIVLEMIPFYGKIDPMYLLMLFLSQQISSIIVGLNTYVPGSINSLSWVWSCLLTWVYKIH